MSRTFAEPPPHDNQQQHHSFYNHNNIINNTTTVTVTKPLPVAARLNSTAHSIETQDRHASAASYAPARSFSSQAPLRRDSPAAPASPSTRHEQRYSFSIDASHHRKQSTVSDPEKQTHLPTRTYIPSPRWIDAPGSTVSTEDDLDTDTNRSCSLSAFVQLCSFAPLLALFTTLFALLAIIYTIVTHPLFALTRSLSSSPSTPTTFTTRLSTIIYAPLRLHLHLIGAPIPSTLLSPDHNDYDPAWRLSVVRAIWIHLLNPFVALTLAGAGWVVLLFWATSAIIADEKEAEQPYPGDEKRHGCDKGGDGKRAASSVAGVWERFEGWGVLWGSRTREG